jgi:methionine synthase II (cobalamin-independent)
MNDGVRDDEYLPALASSVGRVVADQVAAGVDIVSDGELGKGTRENVIAGTDCGFAQGPFVRRVHRSIQWAKLEALAASARLWRR